MIIPIDLDPVALSLGGIAVRWYGLIAVLAVAVAIAIVRRRATREGVPMALVDDGAVWVGVAALVGGRALYLLQNESAELAANPLHAFAIWHGGLSFYGGLIAGLAALWVFARRHRLGFGVAADLVAPAAAAGQAVGHVGCLIGGDSFGLPTDGPLAVVYGNPGAMAPVGVPLHPTQLYEAVALGLLALVLLRVRGRFGALDALGAGGVAAAYLIGNAAIRFGLFFLRDDVIVAGGLKVAQLIAIGVAVAGIAWLIALRRPAAHPRLSEAWR
jgi:phosphatidylglycerol:prolipoprotein diacylglycerol transferase